MCPMNYNPAEFYIDKLAIKPANKEKCIEAVNVIVLIFSFSFFKCHWKYNVMYAIFRLNSGNLR